VGLAHDKDYRESQDFLFGERGPFEVDSRVPRSSPGGVKRWVTTSRCPRDLEVNVPASIRVRSNSERDWSLLALVYTLLSGAYPRYRKVPG
jgi:hypothetical protein